MTFSSNKIASEMFCRFIVNKYIYWSSTVASVYFLVAVTFERYLAIVYPLKYLTYFTTYRLSFMAVFIWVWSFIEEIYLALFTRYDMQIASCVYGIPHRFVRTFVPIFTFLVTFLIPLIALLYMYTHIIVTLKRSSDAHLNGNRKTSALVFVLARRKVVKILLVVFIAFVIFWTPAQVTFLVHHFGIDFNDESGILMKTLVYILPTANSVINPIIYCLIYRQFRKGIFYILRGCPKLADTT